MNQGSTHNSGFGGDAPEGQFAAISWNRAPDAISDSGKSDLLVAPRAMADEPHDPDRVGNTTGVVTRTRPKTQKPPMYKVLLLNDDYTPMEFVVLVLERFFNKNHEEATRIMLHVHQKGIGVCGVFTYEIAETKVTQVIDFARKNQHPLQCTMERD